MDKRPGQQWMLPKRESLADERDATGVPVVDPSETGDLSWW